MCSHGIHYFSFSTIVVRYPLPFFILPILLSCGLGIGLTRHKQAFMKVRHMFIYRNHNRSISGWTWTVHSNRRTGEERAQTTRHPLPYQWFRSILCNEEVSNRLFNSTYVENCLQIRHSKVWLHNCDAERRWRHSQSARDARGHAAVGCCAGRTVLLLFKEQVFILNE
jgi:hypothetical protein